MENTNLLCIIIRKITLKVNDLILEYDGISIGSSGSDKQ